MPSTNVHEHSLSLTIVDTLTPDLYAEMLTMEGATIYHTSAWHCFLTRTFGWRVHAIAVRDEQCRLVWCLPFVRKRRLGFKRVNVCLPLSNRVGPVQQKDVLLETALLLPTSVQPLEVHERVSMPRMHQTVNHYVTELELSKYESLDKLKRSFHKDSIQRKINKAEKGGLKLMKGTQARDFDIFQMLQTETRRRQGSPMYPRHFFHNMREELRVDDLVHLHLVYLNNCPMPRSTLNLISISIELLSYHTTARNRVGLIQLNIRSGRCCSIQDILFTACPERSTWRGVSPSVPIV